MFDESKEVYCVCGCGQHRPFFKMYHYGVVEADGTHEIVGPVIKFHKLSKHREVMDGN